MGKFKSYDFFISCASEDGLSISRELFKELNKHKFSVWFYEEQNEKDDNLYSSIDSGISSSHFGILVLTPHYFSKYISKLEFHAFLSKEMSAARKCIIPIGHGMSPSDISKRTKLLSNHQIISSSVGVGKILERIFSVHGEYLRSIKRISNQQSIVKYIQHDSFPAGVNCFDRENFNIIVNYMKVERFNNSYVSVIDIDDMTKINKVYGIDVGNFVLVRSFEIMIKFLDSEKEVICRCGDDTFMLCGVYKDKNFFESKINGILSSIKNFGWSGFCPGLKVTCSAGLAIKGRDELISDTIIRAGIGMMDAKFKDLSDKKAENNLESSMVKNKKNKNKIVIKSNNKYKEMTEEPSKVESIKHMINLSQDMSHKYSYGPKVLEDVASRSFRDYWS